MLSIRPKVCLQTSYFFYICTSLTFLRLFTRVAPPTYSSGRSLSRSFCQYSLRSAAGGQRGIRIAPRTSGCESGGREYCSNLPNATGCVSVGPDFQCTCAAGYTPQGVNLQTVCSDINECASGQALCEVKLLHSDCINTPGSFECKCNQYREQKDNECVDINECLVNRGGCMEFSDCINNEAAPVTCRCWKGYGGNDGKPGRACQDINECEEPDHCDKDSVCVNTPGSFRCDCKPGFVLNAGGGCERVSFCVSGDNDCDPVFADCEDVPGTYKCTCKEGFEGNGKKGSCRPLPEQEDKACELQGIHCGAYEKCAADEVNVGKYTCKVLSRGEQIRVLMNTGLSSETPFWLWGCVVAGCIVILVAFCITLRVFKRRLTRRRRGAEEELLYGAGQGYDYGAAESY